jgi:glutamyl-tRNA synthetase
VPDGRFAPSPTGRLHLGNLRTALLAWLFARSSSSRFLLRLEDLDAASVRAEHYESQPRDLAALGLDWDGAVERQSDHPGRYQAAIDALTAAGLTYPCWCSRREILDAPRAPHAPPGAYPGTCRDRPAPRDDRRDRPPALRLRTTQEQVVVDDRLGGRFEGVVDDFVLRRYDGTPAYNLAVVVDDAAQGVGEVVRGDDLLASTPRQVHLARLLGLTPPVYAHVPLVLGPDGERLAKRHGAVTLDDRPEGPDGVRSLLAASLGLADPGEPVMPSQLVARFDPDRLPRVSWQVPAGTLLLP